MRFIQFIILSALFLSTSLQAQYAILPEISLKSLYGQEIKLSYLDNGDKPVMIVTWANQWCYPCIRMINKFKPHLAEWENKYGLRFVTVNQDNNFAGKNKIKYLSDERIKEIIKKHNWDFEVYKDHKNEMMNKLKVESAPLILFLYKGQLFHHILSYGTTPEAVEAVLSNIGKDTMYFDSNWYYCLKSKAKYYRKINFQATDSVWAVKDFYIDGKIQMDGAFKSIKPDIRHGKFTWYYKNGNKSSEKTYINGRVDGEVKAWNEQGKITLFENYKLGKKHGTVTYYYKNGNYWSEQEFKDGKLWNIKDVKGPNGELLNFGTLKDGNGIQLNYSEKGIINKKALYKEGNKVYQYNYTDNEGEFISKYLYDKNGMRDKKAELEYIGDKVIQALNTKNISKLDTFLVNNFNYEKVLKLIEKNAKVTSNSKDSLIKEYNGAIEKKIRDINIDALQKHGIFLRNANSKHSSTFIDPKDKKTPYVKYKVYNTLEKVIYIKVKIVKAYGVWVVSDIVLL